MTQTSGRSPKLGRRSVGVVDDRRGKKNNAKRKQQHAPKRLIVFSWDSKINRLSDVKMRKKCLLSFVVDTL